MPTTKWLAPILAAGAAVGVVFGLQVTGSEPAATPIGGEASALSPSSFAELQDRLEQRSRAELGLGAARDGGSSVALDAELNPVPTEALDRAQSAYVEFTAGESRTWRAFVGPGDGAVSPDPCGSIPRDGVLSCEFSTDAETGDVVVEMVTIAVKMDVGDHYMISPDAAQIAAKDPSAVRLERSVKAFHRSGYLTSARETVYSPATTDISQAFETSSEALTAIATDPELDLAQASRD